MSVYWKLTDDEAEELSGLLFRHYTALSRKRSVKEEKEMVLKYWASLTFYTKERNRNAEPGRLHPCPVEFLLDDAQYQRLCALRDIMSCKEPEEVLNTAMTISSTSVINERLRLLERAYRDGAEQKKEESE